jgi:hypothetical protein
MAELAGIVTASTLNLRPTPSTDQPPLAGLPRGTPVEILERRDSWFRVRALGQEGFVHTDFVRLLDPSPAAGFLRERDALRTIPLDPSPQRRIALPANPTVAQRTVARSWNASGGLVGAVSEVVDVAPAAAVAVLCVESSGDAFGPDGRMVIRFENHIFFREWGKDHLDVFREHFRFDDEERFKGHQFRASPAEPFGGFHGVQEAEWRVFGFARALDEPAAIRSISMGLAQVMGFNHHRLGYESPREMFDAFQEDARFQILGMFDFIKGPGTTSQMLQALQQRRFDQFAALYNGPGQVPEYAARLERHFEACQSLLA